jgi:hypothetical protein
MQGPGNSRQNRCATRTLNDNGHSPLRYSASTRHAAKTWPRSRRIHSPGRWRSALATRPHALDTGDLRPTCAADDMARSAEMDGGSPAPLGSRGRALLDLQAHLGRSVSRPGPPHAAGLALGLLNCRHAVGHSELAPRIGRRWRVEAACSRAETRDRSKASHGGGHGGRTTRTS